MKRPLQTLVVFLVILSSAISIALFLKQNPDPIQLEFLQWRTRPLSQGMGALVAFGLGCLVTLLSTVTAVVSKNMEMGRYRREIRALQKMLEDSTQKSDHSNSSKT